MPCETCVKQQEVLERLSRLIDEERNEFARKRVELEELVARSRPPKKEVPLEDLDMIANYNGEWINVRQAAAILRISKERVLQLIGAGHFRTRRDGNRILVAQDDVEERLRRRGVQG